MYGPDEQRWKSVLTKNGSGVKTIIFAGDYEKFIDNGVTKELYYIGAPDGLAAVYVKDAILGSGMLYAHTDQQGSIVSLTDSIGVAVFQASYDAWGKQTVSLNTIGFYRGYTGHEHLPEFGLINMNGRMYDPVLGRFLSPDNYVSSSDFSQAFNRYTYCLNNPLVYVDPDGNNPLIIGAIIIGAVAGGYTGYKIADAKGYNMGDWQTYGYIVGSAAIGGFSGYLGGTIAAGGGFMANTSGIMAGSYMNSMGMTMLSGGDIAPSISFGVASYNFGTGELGYLGKQGNSALENIGYGLGTLANVQDLVALNMGTNVDYNAMKDPVGHGSLTNPDLSINISKGFESGETSIGDGSPWTWGRSKPWGTAKDVYKFPINNVNRKLLEWMTSNTRVLDKDLLGIFKANYSIWGNTCTSQVARSLWYSGVWGLNPFTIHPMSLYLQLMVRQAGIYSSPYLYQIQINKICTNYM